MELYKDLKIPSVAVGVDKDEIIEGWRINLEDVEELSCDNLVCKNGYSLISCNDCIFCSVFMEELIEDFEDNLEGLYTMLARSITLKDWIKKYGIKLGIK